MESRRSFLFGIMFSCILFAAVFALQHVLTLPTASAQAASPLAAYPFHALAGAAPGHYQIVWAADRLRLLDTTSGMTWESEFDGPTKQWVWYLQNTGQAK